MVPPFPIRDASFVSKYSLEDSVARLSGRVKKDNWGNRLSGGGILGIVRRDKVILRYFHPLNVFSGGTRFQGSFVEKDGPIVLIGTFQLPSFARMFLVAWLVITIILFAYSLRRPELLAVPLSMLILWIASILISRRWGRIDVEHVSRTINDSLG
jgi:hypothetical protein